MPQMATGLEQEVNKMNIGGGGFDGQAPFN